MNKEKRKKSEEDIKKEKEEESEEKKKKNEKERYPTIENFATTYILTPARHLAFDSPASPPPSLLLSRYLLLVLLLLLSLNCCFSAKPLNDYRGGRTESRNVHQSFGTSRHW